MKLKTLLQATSFVLGASVFANANAQSFSQCVSTDPVEFDGTIVDAAVATPELSILVDAVLAAGLEGALSGEGPLTVYAPVDSAFAAIPPGILDTILADSALLTTVLTYHVSEGVRDPRLWINPVRRATLAGPEVVFYRSQGHARVNQSAVNCTPVVTSNGIVWLLDSVLMPQFK
jgi:uncharacterized surface protein with fasciclin (FAS1) repeats